MTQNSTLIGEFACGIIVDKQVELAHTLWNRDEAEPLVTKRCPTRDAKHLRG